jgi:glycerol transport system ATP-binding protein
MALELKGVSKTVDGAVHIHPTDLTLDQGTMNVLLGPTLSGKTSLMRLMAGLDVPTTGQVIWNGTDVTWDSGYRTGASPWSISNSLTIRR